MFKRDKKKSSEDVPVVKEVEKQFDIFTAFDHIQKRRNDVNILEISIRQGQIMIILEKDLINLNAFQTLSCMVRKGDNGLLPNYSSIGFVGENPMLIINTNNFKADQFEFSTDFQLLDDIITYAADNICKCPALEIVFSNKYIKCYLDKPGITLEDVFKYEKMFGLKGTLELFGQRPYLLLINDDFEE